MAAEPKECRGGETVEVGDVVRRDVDSCHSALRGKEYTIFDKTDSLSIGDDPNDVCCCNLEWTLVRKKDSIKKNMTTIIEKYRIARMAEPEKSFAKAGIADMNGNLNSEGQNLFNEFLFGKHKEEFKKEVVDPILALKKEEEAK